MKRLVFVPVLVAALACALPGVAGAKPQAKLAPTAVSDPPATAKNGDGFPLTVTISNTGKRDRKARVRVYLRQGSDDVARIAKSDRKRIRAGAERDFALTAVVGLAIPAASYDVVACGVAPATPGSAHARAANLFAFFPTYQRGAMTIQGYREILGDDDVFFDFARALEDRFAYGNVSTQEFIDLAKEFSGVTGPELELLDLYFQEWLYGTEKPTVVPDDFSAP